MDFPILFEDSSLLVIDKPVGISVVENSEDEGGGRGGAVREWVKDRYGYKVRQAGAEDEFEQRYGIVHRLDKETSGVLLIAKNKEVFQYLKGLFKFRRIQKEYQVLVYGLVDDTKFEITAPISRNKRVGVTYSVGSEGRMSSTEFRVLRRVDGCDSNNDLFPMTYLKAYPKTGRTHQIRVHLKAFDHPVVNDSKYANRAQLRSSEGLFQRMMLHAKKITFIDWEGKERVFESPDNLSDVF